jgi:hypothetical protein
LDLDVPRQTVRIALFFDKPLETVYVSSTTDDSAITKLSQQTGQSVV